MRFQLKKYLFLSFQNYAIGWSATIHVVTQDHFGLDVTDIKNRLTANIDFFAYRSFYNGIKTLLSNLFTNFNTIERIENYL
ncbi:DUF3289 family protein [Escherichia coli]